MYTFLLKPIKAIFVAVIALLLFVAAAPAANAQSSTRTITIKNTGSATIYDVYIVPSKSPTWRSDKLSSGETIAPGQEKTFSLSYGGTYDLLVEDARGRDIAEVNNVLMSENKVWTIDQIALVVKNNAEEPICYMYISPSSSRFRGSDWLDENEMIDPNSEQVFYVHPGSYNLLAQNCDRNHMASTNNVSLYSAKVWTVGQATVDFTIVNQSGWRICDVYISPTASGTWEPDWLPNGRVIYDGWQRTFEVEVGTYDLLVQDCYGHSLDKLLKVRLDEDLYWTIE